MKSRPLCVVCFLYIFIQGMILLWTSGEQVAKIPAASIYFESEEQEIVIRGQVYQISNTSNMQQIYLKNNSVFDSHILVYDQNFTDVSIGQFVTLRGTTSTFERSPNPGNFDQAMYYAKKEIYGVVWCEEILAVEGKVDWLLDGLYRLKQQWKNNIQTIMGNKEGSVLSAMLLAEKGEMDSEVKELYQKNGISHILAISGLHISFIGLGLYKLIRKGGLSYLWAGLCSVGILTIYVLMIGMSISVFRAYLMLLLRIGADITGRAYDMMTALLLAAAITVAGEPLCLTDAGFYLSYGAVLGILLVIPALKNSIPCKGKVAEGLLSSIGINVMLLPVLLWFYFEFPPYSVLWNLVVIPLMSLVMGFGMFGSLLAFLWKPLGVPFLYVCKLILQFYEAIGRWGTRLPMSSIVLGKPEVGLILLYYGILLAVILLIPRIQKKRRRIWLWLFPVFVIVLMAIPKRWTLSVTMLNVGQGDAIFVRGPSGNTYLIDGGSSDVKGLAKYRLEPFLKSQGIGTLDYVFLTHGDLDHCNGVEEMLERVHMGVQIRCLVLPANYRQDEMLLRIAKKAIKVGTKVHIMQAGEQLKEGNLRLTCIQPFENDVLEKNAGSLILDLSYGQFSMLFTGDVEKEGEEMLIQNLRGKSYTVLKVAHHGSVYSTSQELLDIIRPKLALISAGKDNRYQHPHPDIIQRLKEEGCTVLQTTKNGAITIETDGNSLTIY